MKVDLVVPMVFTDDPVWFKRYRIDSIKEGRQYRNSSRVRSWGLELFFFRGIDRFMPWVNNIHVILAQESQLPVWLTNVHVVYHRDIIPAELLPTYNSQTIEMFIGNIQGLSKHFIYCNDDMICCSPMQRRDFFLEGLPVCYCSESYVDDIRGVFHRSIRNSMELAARDTECTFRDDVLLRDGHSYAPMLLPVVKEMQTLYGQEMQASCTRFRREKNISQYLYTFRQWLTMRCIDGRHKHHYFDQLSEMCDVREVLEGGNAGICCFNDNEYGDYKTFAEDLSMELLELFPTPCKYEKSGAKF